MKLIKHGNINDFLDSNEKLLLQRESFHNLILGLAYSIRDKKIETTEPLFYSVLDEGNLVIGAALRSNVDRSLIVTEMSSNAVDLLIKDLSKCEISLKSVVGEEVTATHFKDQWIKINKLNFNVHIHLGVYECFKVVFPKMISGNLIEATSLHHSTLVEYITGFQKDCFPQEVIITENIENLIKRYLDNRYIYLLVSEDDEIVSMAANTRSTLNGGTISLVYTPPGLRGKGHASNAVALLADKLLNDGKKFACLFTDLTNPTSNSIYQKIGFEKIGQNIHYDFIPYK